MQNKTKILLSVLLCVCILLAVVPTAVYMARGSLKQETLPDDFTKQMQQYTRKMPETVRVMSANLLVDYKSWGGEPVKPRAKQFVEMLSYMRPDVVGLQEMSDGWYCALRRNLPEGYKMLYPVSSGVLVRMTAMVYNTKTLELIDSGQFAYPEGDNPRLRRVVWAVFETKSDGERFAVTDTHFDLLRDGREEELTAVMQSQAETLVSCVSDLDMQYNCPVFSVGDFNTKEDTPETPAMDIPAIYNYLCEQLIDVKYAAEESECYTEALWDAPSYDHIFMSQPVSVLRFGIFHSLSEPQLSGHDPIFADFVL